MIFLVYFSSNIEKKEKKRPLKNILSDILINLIAIVSILFSMDILFEMRYWLVEYIM